MTSLKQFKEWLQTRPEVLNIGFDPVSQRFILREDQERWEAWQASREAVEVELMPPHNDYENYGDSYVEGAAKYYAQAKKAIEAVGMKVK